MLEMPTATAATAAHAAFLFQREDAPRDTARSTDHWCTELLDHLDLGVVVVRRDLAIVHANRTARLRLRLDDDTGTLRRHLARANDAYAKPIALAVAQATDRGLRSTVHWPHGADEAVLAVVPMRHRDALDSPLAMVLTERERLCTPLALAGFGRLQGLTGAQVSVLGELCAGHEPAAIAARLGVSLSTVRTHVVASRSKLSAGSVREMLLRVARLPPIVEILRGAGR